ncbi:MAG: hypothetical protein KBC69_03440 [Candidatus Magasanikbacteria bacterium]|nr:hypothetical protein [Candidatus Magasanikbacteria bacterium]
MKTVFIVTAIVSLVAACSSGASDNSAKQQSELVKLQDLQSKVRVFCDHLPQWAENQLAYTDEVMAAAAFEASNWFQELCPGMEGVAKTIQDAKLSSSPSRHQTIRQTLKALGERR